MNKVFILTLLSLFTFSLHAELYLGGGYGYGKYSDDELFEYKVSPQGPGYTLIAGNQISFFGLEAFYSRNDLEHAIKHSGNSYTLKQDVNSYGVAARFNLRYLFAKFGYAIHRMDRQAYDGSEKVDDQGISQVYNLGSDKGSSGMVFGGGLRWRPIQNLAFIAEFNRYLLSNMDASINCGYAGLIIYFGGFDLFSVSSENER